MFALAAIAWQLAGIAHRHGREALPIAVTLLLGCVGMLVIAFEFLFSVPIVFSMVTVACAGVVVVLLRRGDVAAPRLDVSSRGVPGADAPG